MPAKAGRSLSPQHRPGLGGGVHYHQPAGVDFRRGLGDPPLDGLAVGQALAPLSQESIKSQVERMLPRTLF